MSPDCPCTPECTPMDEHIEQSEGLLSNTARPSSCRMLTTPARVPTPQRPGPPRRVRSITSGPSLPCLTSSEAPSRACSPAPLRPSSAPPEAYPDIPESKLSQLPEIAAGQSGKVLLLTPITVLKLPMPDHTIDLENEYEIGIVLKYHPIGSLRVFIHGTDDTGVGVTNEHIDQLTRHRMKWAQQVADGVQFLHQNGIVHCDTSSANTLITSSYDAVLCDFSSSLMDDIAKGGKTRCSRWYKFVENGDDDSFGEGRLYTIQDDLWAIGTVCYEMWARKRLWGALPDAQRVLLYKANKWPCLEGIGHMGNVIAKCWADQYGCAGEVLADIGEAAEWEEGREKEKAACHGEQECVAWDAVD